MADLPIYQSNNQYEVRGAPEVYSSYEHMASAFNQFSENLMQHSQMAEKVQATERGALEGSQKDYSPKGIPLTPVAYAERAAAIQAHTNVIDQDIKNKVSELYTEHASIITPDSLKNFQSNLLSWSSAYLKNTPAVFRPNAQLTLEQYASSAQNRIVSSLSQMTQKSQAADIKSGFDNQMQDVMSTARTNPEMAQERYNQMVNSAAELRERNVIDESYFNQIRFNGQEKLNEEKQIGRIYRMAGQGRIAEWKDGVQNDPSLNQLQKDSVLAKGEAVVSSLISQMKGRDLLNDQEMQKNLQEVNQTGNVNTALQSAVDNRDTLEKAQDYALSQHTQATLGTLAAQVRYSPSSTVNSLVNSIKIDPNDPYATQKQIVRKGLEEWNHQRNQMIAADPADYFNNSPVVNSAVEAAKTSSYVDEATNENVPFYKLPPERQQQVITSARIGARLAEQKQFGVSQDKLSAITNQEAISFISKLKSLPLDQQPFVTSHFLRSFDPDQEYYVSRDLQRNGMPMASQYLTKIMNTAESRPYLDDAAIAWSHMGSGKENSLSDYEPVLKSKGLKGWADVENRIANASTPKQYQEALGAMGANYTGFYREYIEHVKVLSAQLMSRGMDVDSAIDKASQVMLSDINFHTYNGQTFFAPKEVSDRNISDAISILQDQYENSDVNMSPIFSFIQKGSITSVIHKMLGLQTSYVSTTSDQRGVQLMDQSGSPVFTKDGKPLVILFKDMMDPTSQFYKDAAKFHTSTYYRQQVEKSFEVTP